MHVWLVKIGEKLPIDDGSKKLRAVMLAEKLIARGHTVLLWASAFDHFKKKWVFKKDKEICLNADFNIIALKGLGYRKNISLRRYVDHRLLARKFRNMAPMFKKPDVIVAAMPSYDLCYESILYARARDIPVVVDVRDQWPDLFIENVPSFLRGVARFVLSPDFRTIKNVMHDADSIVSMMEFLLKWGLNYAGRSRTDLDRVFYLGSKREANAKFESEKITNLLAGHKDKFIVTFIGTFASYHNPSILVEAAKRLQDLPVTIVLAGDGELFCEVKRQAEGLQNVIFPGWLNQQEITSLLRRSHLGVCTTTRKAYFFPNKAFTYFSEGLPVLSAFEGDLRDLIEQRQMGSFFAPDDTDSLVENIRAFATDQEMYGSVVNNVRKALNEIFDADAIYEAYAQHIENVAKTYRNKVY